MKNTWNGQVPTFTITDVKLYVPVLTLSSQDNSNVLQQLKSGFKTAINWNKYHTKATLQTRKWYLDYLIDPGFQTVNRYFVLSFENDVYRTSYKWYFLATVKM